MDVSFQLPKTETSADLQRRKQGEALPPSGGALLEGGGHNGRNMQVKVLVRLSVCHMSMMLQLDSCQDRLLTGVVGLHLLS